MTDIREFFGAARGGKLQRMLKEKPYPHGMACPACGKIVKEAVDADVRFRWPRKVRAYCADCDWRTYRVRLIGKGW